MSQTQSAQQREVNIIGRVAYTFCNAIEKGTHQFPFNIFFGLQSLAFCQWVSDFAGGVVEYPLSIIQMYHFYYEGRLA